ncbi:unnamed protein product, partial [Symbiodinium necroappetens]
VLSCEHDGLGIQLNGLSEAALLEALNFNPMVRVAIKAPHDPLELAREQFPGEEWVGPAAVSSLQFDAAELHRALLVTRRCVQPMKPRKEDEPEPPSAADNAVVGKVLAAHLEGDVLVPEGDNVFLQYLPDKSRWESQKICDKGLHGFARQYSHIFEPVHCCWVDGVLQKRPRGGRLRPHVEVSYPLGKPSFLNTLAHESLIYLRCPAPKRWTTRCAPTTGLFSRMAGSTTSQNDPPWGRAKPARSARSACAKIARTREAREACARSARARSPREARASAEVRA